MAGDEKLDLNELSKDPRYQLTIAGVVAADAAMERWERRTRLVASVVVAAILVGTVFAVSIVLIFHGDASQAEWGRRV